MIQYTCMPSLMLLKQVLREIRRGGTIDPPPEFWLIWKVGVIRVKVEIAWKAECVKCGVTHISVNLRACHCRGRGTYGNGPRAGPKLDPNRPWIDPSAKLGTLLCNKVWRDAMAVTQRRAMHCICSHAAMHPLMHRSMNSPVRMQESRQPYTANQVITNTLVLDRSGVWGCAN